MSLEKNIERIADALEALAKAAGAKCPLEGEDAATGRAAERPQGQAPIQQGPSVGWQGQTPQNVPGAGQQPPVQQRPQMQPQGNQIPLSLPTGTGMQWQGAGNNAAAPGTLPGQQPGRPFQQPGTVPTTASAKQYTFDQLAVATANLASAGKDVFTVLGRFGVSMLMDLPQEKYGEYAAALREAGAVI